MNPVSSPAIRSTMTAMIPYVLYGGLFAIAWTTLDGDVRANELPGEQKPSVVDAGKIAQASKPTTEAPELSVAFEDDYDDRSELGEHYTTARGMKNAWRVENGILTGKQTNDDHGAVIRTELTFDDVEIEFDVRFRGGKSFNFVIDDKNEKSVHAGHICRMSLSAKSMRISDDKTGSMNLNVRNQRKNKNLSPQETAGLSALLARTQATAITQVTQDHWHHIRIRIRGDQMKAFFDGDIAVQLRSPGFDHPSKNKLGFTVNGAEVDFDNFKIKPLANTDLKIKLGPIAKSSIFGSKDWSHWGGSVVKGDDGLYHMFYSRWPTKLGWAWVTDSEVAHAIAPSPLGPFRFQGVALPRRGKEHWDGWCTHNPTVHKVGERYFLYYMGNTGDGEVVGTPGKQTLNWQHRNNQRIGVAVADSPHGPWTRFDKPVLDISDAPESHDALMTSNPSFCLRTDGSCLMVYKAVGKQFAMPNGGPVVHCVATSNNPLGPFKKQPDPVFTFEGERFPAEDPYIWFQAGKYRAIVKRIKHEAKKRVFSLVHYDSIDGVHWEPAQHHEVSDRTVTWADGTAERLDHLERPQVVIENGRPIALICAADRIDEHNVRRTFNVQIPLVVTEIPADRK